MARRAKGDQAPWIVHYWERQSSSVSSVLRHGNFNLFFEAPDLFLEDTVDLMFRTGFWAFLIKGLNILNWPNRVCSHCTSITTYSLLYQGVCPSVADKRQNIPVYVHGIRTRKMWRTKILSNRNTLVNLMITRKISLFCFVHLLWVKAHNKKSLKIFY